MKTLATLALLAGFLPAQYSLYNLTVPPNTTVIDWQGRPALCIITGTPYTNFFATFRNNYLWPQGPDVQLALQGIAVWDFRPCAVGSGARIASYDIGSYLPINIASIVSGLEIVIPYPIVLTYNRLDMNPTHYWVDYCPITGPCGTCHLSNDGPQGVCVVATLLLK